MKTTSPKILPWLAHKAGIPLARAEILWQVAESHAARASIRTDTPEYWKIAMDRLIELVTAESLREDAASYGWRRLTRLHMQLLRASLAVLDAATINNIRGWRNFKPFQFG